jgi:hypothetical protein
VKRAPLALALVLAASPARSDTASTNNANRLKEGPSPQAAESAPDDADDVNRARARRAQEPAADAAPAGPRPPRASASGTSAGPSASGAPGEVGRAGGQAYRKAAQAAEAFDQRPDAGALPGAALDAPSARSAAPRELELASLTGYRHVFESLGLALGPGPDGRQSVLRRDGAPASSGEIAELKTRLASEPAALARRPDFFAVLPRAHFEELKRAYRERPELKDTAFKHIRATAATRDFAWAQSCSPVSSDCNESAAGAYRKGAKVEPETLARVWKRARRPSADDAYTAEDKAAAQDEDRRARLVAAGALKPGFGAALSARLTRLLSDPGSAWRELPGPEPVVASVDAWAPRGAAARDAASASEVRPRGLEVRDVPAAEKRAVPPPRGGGTALFSAAGTSRTSSPRGRTSEADAASRAAAPRGAQASTEATTGSGPGSSLQAEPGSESSRVKRALRAAPKPGLSAPAATRRARRSSSCAAALSSAV